MVADRKNRMEMKKAPKEVAFQKGHTTKNILLV